MLSYSWATAVHQSILFNLAKARYNGSVNIGICLFAVNIWFIERCHIYEGRVMMGGVPMYYNWSMRQRMKDSAVNEMFQTLSAPLICKKDLPFVHDNEPMIVKVGCKLCLPNKCVVELENKKRKKPQLKRGAVRKRYAGRPRAQEEEEEEGEEEIEIVQEEEEEEGDEVELQEESGGEEEDKEKDEEEEEEAQVEEQEVQVQEEGAQEKEAEAAQANPIRKYIGRTN